MKTVQIGIGTEYANLGSDPDFITDPVVAVNASNRVISIYGDLLNNLYYNIGTIDGAVIDWGGSKPYVSGAYSAVALNNANQFVEVHRTSNAVGTSLWWYSGSISNDNTLSHGSGISEDTLHGSNAPSIALSNVGVVAGVYQNSTTQFICKVGSINSSANKIDWHHDTTITGTHPTVAFNDGGGLIVVYYNNNGNLCYKLGQLINGNTAVSWASEVIIPGVMKNTNHDPHPSVAYTNDTIVIVYCDYVLLDLGGYYYTLKSITANYVPGTISVWTTPAIYDYGISPSVAANNNYAVQVHKSQDLNDIYYSISLITDRANWMRNLISDILYLKLGQIVMPATHDAGMYCDWTLPESKTQDLNMLGQLTGGVRYFDLRPKYDSSSNNFNIYHGPSTGDSIDNILSEVQDFMQNYQSNEFVILKFSHFSEFGDDVANNPIYQIFVNKITTSLSHYLCNQPSDTKFGTINYEHLVNSGGRVLVVCSDYAINTPNAGIYVYRDGYLGCPQETRTTDPTQGNLVVWDCYSNTTTTSTMENDQLNSLAAYTGYCDGSYSTIPCDMFLLSWTLTPWTKSVWLDSENPNRNLGAKMNLIGLNAHNKIPNLLYVNYFEYARATDIAIMMNKRLSPIF